MNEAIVNNALQNTLKSSIRYKNPPKTLDLSNLKHQSSPENKNNNFQRNLLTIKENYSQQGSTSSQFYWKTN
jgi:hypothetical protein